MLLSAGHACALFQGSCQFLYLSFQHLLASPIQHQAMMSHEAHFVVMNRYQQHFQAGLPATHAAAVSIQLGTAEQQHLTIGFVYFVAVFWREPTDRGRMRPTGGTRDASCTPVRLRLGPTAEPARPRTR